ncbi:MAG: FAD:protein FMN transferase [Actinomycetota bacterium]|nr:FAD:protein FMN transferase [Actinomycetota bacterium]
MADYSFDAIGTGWHIETVAELEPQVRAAVAAVVEVYDRTYSRFRPDSLVSSIAAAPGSYQLPATAARLQPLFATLYRLTRGGVTPLIAASLDHLGYDAGYSLRPAPGFRTPPRWEDVLAWNGSSLHTGSPLMLDVGAAGKGQLVDLVAAELSWHGVTEYLIDASGDMLRSGGAPVRVALEHPYNPRQAIGVVELGAGALCASAANRRTWGNGLHHVLDGLTGKPVDAVVATWALAEEAMVADGLATALFFVDHAVLSQEFSFASVRVFSDGRAEISANFEGEIFQ